MRQNSFINKFLLLTVLGSVFISIGGCALPTFSEFEPRRGATCTEVRITSEGHHCGNFRVLFNGVPADNPCFEGPGANHCEPPRAGDPAHLIAVVPQAAPVGLGPLTVWHSVSGTGCVLLGAFSGGGPHELGNFTVTRQLAQPVATLRATPVAISPGQTAELTWSVTGSPPVVQPGAWLAQTSRSRSQDWHEAGSGNTRCPGWGPSRRPPSIRGSTRPWPPGWSVG